MVVSSSLRPVRAAAGELAALSAAAHDGFGWLSESVLHGVAAAGQAAGPALPRSAHDALRLAGAGMSAVLAGAAEQVSLTTEAVAGELEALLGPVSAGSAPATAAATPTDGSTVAVDVPAALTAEQAYALHHYTTIEGVEEMNRYLRRPDLTPPGRRAQLRQLVAHAAAGLAALPRFDGVSYRGTDLPAAQLPRWQPGAVVADRGFASSSASVPVAEAFRCGGNAFIAIAGRSGADIRSLSSFRHEAEVLFRPGTRFRVVGRSWDDRRECWSFQLEEVDPCVSTATPTTG